MVPRQQPKVALQHPTWGDVSVQLPVPKAPLFSWSAKYRLGGARRGPVASGQDDKAEGASQPTTLHIQNVQSCAGFGKLASPANQRLDRFSLLVGQTKRSAILACAEPVILLPGLRFTLTHIHEICTKFNEGYTLQRMADYGYASGIDRFGLHKRL